MLKERIFRIGKWLAGIVAILVLSISATLYFFKDDICNIAISQVNKHLKAKVTVAHVDLSFWSSFPNLSIDFNEVFIQDSYEGSTKRDTLLFSDRIRCKFDPMDLWNENYTIKSIEVSPGTIQLKVNEEGLNNYDIFKEQNDSLKNDGFELNLNAIKCEGIRFSYLNAATKQEYRTEIEVIDIEGALSTGAFKATAQSNLKILSAKSGNINLVRNQHAQLHLGVNVNTDSSAINIPSSTIYIANLPFNFKGDFDRESYNFDLSAKSIKIDEAANALALSETNQVKKFSGSGSLIFDLNVQGENESIKPAEVFCSFGVDNGRLVDPNSGIALSQLNIKAEYSNKRGKEKEHLEMSDISFATEGGVFNGNLMLTNFENPQYNGEANGLINLAIFHSLFRIPQVDKMQGSVDVSSKFQINTIPSADGRDNYKIERCTGKMKLNDVLFKLMNDKREFKNIEGTAYLRNDEVGMENISLALGKSDLTINGVFKELSAYLSHQGNLIADVELNSREINIEDLGQDSKEEHILQERTYMLPDDIDGSVYLNISRLNYEGHSFENLVGNMLLERRLINFPRISVLNGGANVNGSLIIEEKRPEIFYISSQLVSKDIDFGKLFKEWNNFNQDVITSNNISGEAQANVKLDAPFDLRSGIISDAIKAEIGIQIDNGRLRNVETFKSITESLRNTSSARLAIGKDNIDEFEKKLLDLRFDRLENTLVIKNSVLTIPTMSIKSSALDLETSGKHTFDNKVDYRFGFRFRDLKKKEVSEFGDVVDDGSGKFVFMRMYGDLSNPTIQWDKQSSREKRKEYNEEEVKDAKSILKTEFGLFKNDTTVKTFIQEKRTHEILEVEFNPIDQIDTLIEEKKPKKDTKARRTLDKWKKEFEEAKKEEIKWE